MHFVMKVLLGLGGWQDAGLLPSSGAQVTLVLWMLSWAPTIPGSKLLRSLKSVFPEGAERAHPGKKEAQGGLSHLPTTP